MSMKVQRRDVRRFFTYHAPTPQAVAAISQVRRKLLEVGELMADSVPEGPEFRRAVAKLREASMWFNAAAVTPQPGQRPTSHDPYRAPV